MKRRNRRTKHYRAAFTLMEVVFAIMIVGLGVVAMMGVFASGTRVNGYGNHLSTGVFLADELRSMTDEVEFDYLLDYDNQTFNGVDAGGNSVAGLASYQQQLDVTAVNPADMSEYIGPDPEIIRLKAIVSRNGEEVTRTSWLRRR